ALLRAALRAALRDGLPWRPANERRCRSSASATSPADARRLLVPLIGARGARSESWERRVASLCDSRRSPNPENGTPVSVPPHVDVTARERREARRGARGAVRGGCSAASRPLRRSEVDSTRPQPPNRNAQFRFPPHLDVTSRERSEPAMSEANRVGVLEG